MLETAWQDFFFEDQMDISWCHSLTCPGDSKGMDMGDGPALLSFSFSALGAASAGWHPCPW